MSHALCRTAHGSPLLNLSCTQAMAEARPLRRVRSSGGSRPASSSCSALAPSTTARRLTSSSRRRHHEVRTLRLLASCLLQPHEVPPSSFKVRTCTHEIFTCECFAAREARQSSMHQHNQQPWHQSSSSSSSLKLLAASKQNLERRSVASRLQSRSQS